jgi:hypothetical protein
MPNGVGPPGGVAKPGAGHQYPPTPKLAQGPTGAARARNAVGVPPLPSGRHATPVRRRRRSEPPGARARRAKRGSRDSADRARWARLPARRAATVRQRPDRTADRRVRSGPGSGPGGAQWRGPRPGARLPAAARSAGGATRIRACPRGRPEKAMYKWNLPREGGFSAEGPMGGAGVSARNAWTGLTLASCSACNGM